MPELARICPQRFHETCDPRRGHALYRLGVMGPRVKGNGRVVDSAPTCASQVVNLPSAARLPRYREVRGFASPPHSEFAFSWTGLLYLIRGSSNLYH
jgi:hypothetical protein